MQEKAPTSIGDILARVFWMMIGPMILGISCYMIVNNPNGWLTVPDFTFLSVLAAMLLARWLEFRGGHPRTADGEPATRMHLRRYVIGLTIAGLSVWVAANILANHVLQS